jgi:hypothetical protein
LFFHDGSEQFVTADNSPKPVSKFAWR